MLGSVVAYFQITFCAEMHANDVFLFFKNYFWYQHIKTIQKVQTILNFSKKDKNKFKTYSKSTQSFFQWDEVNILSNLTKLTQPGLFCRTKFNSYAFMSFYSSKSNFHYLMFQSVILLIDQPSSDLRRRILVDFRIKNLIGSHIHRQICSFTDFDADNQIFAILFTS